MRSTIEIVKCDIQGCGSEGSVKKATLQVVFTTEQTEGRGVEPYLQNASIDICEKCFGRLLNGEMIFADGAQGYNTYYFKKN